MYLRVLYVRPETFGPYYVAGSKSFRPDIQKPRQMENAERYIVPSMVRLKYQLKSVLK